MITQIREIGYPAPEIYYSGEIHLGISFYVQEFIKGKQVRSIRAGRQLILNQLQDFFVDLHSNVNLPGFGKIYNIDGRWQGTSGSWPDALVEKVQDSFRRVSSMGIVIHRNLERRLGDIIKKNLGILDIRRGSLLHDDAGLINFLGRGKRLVAILDPEFAIIGDPAYEFSDKIGKNRDYSMNFISSYLRKIKKKLKSDLETKQFIKRSTIYSPFIVLDIIPNLGEIGNIDGAKYFLSILPREIDEADSL